MSAQLGDVARVRGRLAQVVAINEGHRNITFEFIGTGQKPCSKCGRRDDISINEGCLNWEKDVEPVSTCGDT